MRDFKEQLKGLEDARRLYGPDKTWVEKNRGLLLSQIRNTVKDEETAPSFMDRLVQAFHLLVPQQVIRRARPVMAVCLVLALTISGWMTSASASESLPGDLLWNVKLAQEKTEVAITDMTGSSREKAEVRLKHAARRAEEIKQVSSAQKPESAKKVKIATERLKHSLESANKTVEKAQKENPGEVVEIVKEFSAVTSEIFTSLREVSAKASESEEIVQATKETSRVVQRASLEAVEVILDSTASAPSREEIRTIVEQKVDAVIELSEILYAAASTTQPLVVETSVSTTVPTVATDPVSILREIPLNSERAKTLSEEVKKLIEGNQLSEAVRKAKELLALQSPTPDATDTASTSSPVLLPDDPTASTSTISTTTATDTVSSTDIAENTEDNAAESQENR